MEEYTVKINKIGDIYWYKKDTDILHRSNGPAIELANGNKAWYKDGLLEREDGPALEYVEELTKISGYKTVWYKKDTKIIHRDNGPAVEHINGDKVWYKNGKKHREDGPAVEYANGSKEWYKNGKCHRENGPARTNSDGYKEYWLNGNKYSEFAFAKITKYRLFIIK